MNRIELNLKNDITLSREMQQSLELLTLSQDELEKKIDEEVVSNPFLKKSEHESTFRHVYSMGEIKGIEAYERKGESDLSLGEDLLNQLGCIKGLKEIEMYKFVVNLLDRNGYLRIDKQIIAADLNISITRVDEIISAIQNLDPPGVGASTFQECLCIQIEREQVKDQCAYDICASYLEEVARGQIKSIVRESGYSEERIRKAIAKIKTLNPKPGNGYRQEEAVLIYPEAEIIVEGEKVEIHYFESGNYDVEIVSIDLDLNKLNEIEKKFVRDKSKTAQTLVKQLSFRRKTIKNVIEVLVKIQKNYFCSGEALVPLRMSEVADVLEINQSTVSRAVNGKYIIYQYQMIPIKSFFSRSIDQENSVEVIKRKIQELIEKEDKRKAYSDAILAEKLKETGVDISRRTVAKYRDELKILTASLRRQR